MNCIVCKTESSSNTNGSLSCSSCLQMWINLWQQITQRFVKDENHEISYLINETYFIQRIEFHVKNMIQNRDHNKSPNSNFKCSILIKYIDCSSSLSLISGSLIPDSINLFFKLDWYKQKILLQKLREIFQSCLLCWKESLDEESQTELAENNHSKLPTLVDEDENSNHSAKVYSENYKIKTIKLRDPLHQKREINLPSPQSSITSPLISQFIKMLYSINVNYMDNIREDMPSYLNTIERLKTTSFDNSRELLSVINIEGDFNQVNDDILKFHYSGDFMNQNCQFDIRKWNGHEKIKDLGRYVPIAKPGHICARKKEPLDAYGVLRGESWILKTFSNCFTFLPIIDNKIALNTNNDRLNKLLSTCIAHAIHFFKRNVNEVEINYKAYFQKLGREEYYCDIVYQLYSGLRPCMIVTEMFFRLVYFHSIKPLNSIEDLYKNGNIDYFDRGFLNLLIIKDFSDKKKQGVINNWREKLWKLCILFTYDSNRQIFLLNEKYYFTVENIETQMIFTYGIKEGSRFVKLLKEIASKINQQNRFNKHILVFALMFRLLLEVNRAAISFESNSFSSNCEKTQDKAMIESINNYNSNFLDCFSKIMAQYYSSNRMTSFLDGVIEFLEEAVVKKLFYVSQNACIDELRIAEDFKAADLEEESEYGTLDIGT